MRARGGFAGAHVKLRYSTRATLEVLAIVTKSVAGSWLAQFASPERGKFRFELKDDLSRFLQRAETQAIGVTRHGKPTGVAIAFEWEEDWFDTVSNPTRDSCLDSNRRGTAIDILRGISHVY